MLKWEGDWMTYIDGMLQLYSLSQPTNRAVHQVNRITSVNINPGVHLNRVDKIMNMGKFL